MNNPSVAAKKSRVEVGDTAPDFMLSDQNGQPVHLADLIGKSSIVLYFYPKDETMGCTAEACAFRDSFEVFKQAGAIVIGVSDDSSESHAAFAQHHRLPFTLLSDPGGTVRTLYGVAKTFGIMPGRVTYVIDKQGIVRHTFNSRMNGPAHVSDALRMLKTINA